MRRFGSGKTPVGYRLGRGGGMFGVVVRHVMRCGPRLRIVCLLLFLLLFSLSCRGDQSDDENVMRRRRVDEHGRIVLAPQERAAIGLEMAAAEQGTLTTSALRFGRVVARPQEDALVIAPVTGRL